MVPESLRVELYGRHVADIDDAGLGQCGLRYTAQARATGAPARLSLSLPIREQPYAAVEGAMRWLRALLPEGPALQAAAEHYQIPADDMFSLLSVLGRDVAGAVVIARGDEAEDRPAPSYRLLDPDELTELIGGLRHRPLGLDRERGVRLSLAGVQAKAVLHREPRSKRLYQPIGGAPSTVIVKPEPGEDSEPRFEGLATNEALCLALAKRVRLDAAHGTVEVIGGRPCLVVQRYDRMQRDGTVMRVHQEDLLAALGRDPWLKYEVGNTRRITPGGGFTELSPVRSQPGPGLDEMAELIAVHVGKAGLIRLAEIVAFNMLIGNADAHARNLSVLLLQNGTVRLAPLYDLACTRLYPAVDTTAAQAVAGESDIDAVTLGHLRSHAAGWGLPDQLLADRLPKLVRKAQAVLPNTVAETVRNGGDPVHAHRVAELVGQRAEHLLSGS